MLTATDFPWTRYGIAVLVSLVTTFLLFYLMQSLISSSPADSREPSSPYFVPFVNLEKAPPPPPPRERPHPPEPQDPPPAPEFETRALPTSKGGISVSVPPVEQARPPDWGRAAMPDREPLAIVKPPPAYPRSPLLHGIEGHVIVEYTVTASGAVTDIRVVESEPAGVFDRAAVEAASRFRYQPAVRDGRAVAAGGVRNLFTFRLEE